MEVSYIIYNPAGNITALVIGDEYNLEQRKLINDKIMRKESQVEQVGFLSTKEKKLSMAGGEFCGNATRCAALYYIKKVRRIKLKIGNIKVESGIDKNNEVWCEVPIEDYKIERICKNIYQITLKGITILVVKNIKNNKNYINDAKALIKKYELNDSAIGIMFVDIIEDIIKIYPVVWVREIETIFLENACGSGTIAVTMLESFINKKSDKYKVQQPSGDILSTEIEIENNIINKAILKGKIQVDNKIRKIIV